MAKATRRGGGGNTAPRNRLLWWARMERGWSREELVKQVAESMQRAGDTNPGLSAETVRGWEMLGKSPQPLYSKHLVAVLGKPASELGLLTSEQLALRPVNLSRGQGPVIDSTLVVGVVSEVVRQVLHVVRQEESGHQWSDVRRAWQQLDGALSEPDTPVVFPVRSSTGRVLDPHLVDSIRTTALAQQHLYFSTAPDRLLDAVVAHLVLGVDALVPAQVDSREFRQLAGAVALTALLAARLTFFDLGQPERAQECLALAWRAAGASGDPAVAAAVQAHRAFPPGFAGDAVLARQHLDAALDLARRVPSPRLLAWVHCVAAEIHARTGGAAVSLDHIGRAEQTLAGEGEDPDWLNYFDRSRLNGFAGQASLLAGHTVQAVSRLRTALDELGPQGTKQRSVLLLDLAIACAASDAEEAAACVREAIITWAREPYAAAQSRIPEVLTAVQATPYAGEVEDALRALTVATQPPC